MTIQPRKSYCSSFISCSLRSSDGTCVRDYLHVLDLAKGHLLALEGLSTDSKVFDNCPTEARYKAYNLGKGRGVSVLQIVEAMRKATGFDYKWEVIGRRYTRMNLSRSLYLTNIKPGQARGCPRSNCGSKSCREGAGFHSTRRIGYYVQRSLELADEKP